MRKKRLKFSKKGINYEVIGVIGEWKTHKDVGIDEVVQDAIRNKVNTICAITSGNYGVSLRRAVEMYNMEVSPDEALGFVGILHPDISEKIQELLSGSNSIPLVCEDMRTKWLGPADRERYVQQELKKRRLKPGVVKDYTDFIPKAYYDEARPILEKNLDYIFVPVGSGRSFITLYRALEQLKREGKAIKTRIVGVVPMGDNPIYHNFIFERQENRISVKRIEGYNPTSIADKLVCPDTIYKEEIKRAKSEGYAIVEVGNAAFKKANMAALKYGHNLEYSGSASFVALDKRVRVALSEQGIDIKKGDNIGLFVTGKGFYTSSEYESRKIRLAGLLDTLARKTVPILAMISIVAISNWIRTPERQRARDYEKLVDEIVQIYEQDPNGMGLLLGERIFGDPSPISLNPYFLRKYLMQRYSEEGEWRLDSNNVSRIIVEHNSNRTKPK